MRYAVVLGYCAVMTSWIFGGIYWVNTGHGDSWWTVAPLAIVPLALGFALGFALGRYLTTNEIQGSSVPVIRRATVIVYACLAFGWVYGVLNTDRWTDDPWSSSSAALVIAGVVAATGFVIGRWWAPILALLPAVLALPAGYSTNPYDEAPLWFYLGYSGLIIGVPLMAGAVGLRWLFELAMRARPGSPSAPGSALAAASRRPAHRP